MISIITDSLYLYNPVTQTYHLIFGNEASCPVYTKADKVYVIDRSMNILAEYQENLLYTPFAERGDYLCVLQEGDCRFIDKSGNFIAKLDYPVKQLKIIGEKIVILTEDNRLIYLTWEDIIANRPKSPTEEI